VSTVATFPNGPSLESSVVLVLTIPSGYPKCPAFPACLLSDTQTEIGAKCGSSAARRGGYSAHA